MTQKISILGSTGSIGQSTLDVLRSQPEFEVFALSGHQNVKALSAQCQAFGPRFAVLTDPDDAALLAREFVDLGLDTEVLCGQQGLQRIASDPVVDTVMAAIVGGAGLQPTLAAVAAGKKVLLANKESLVMAGQLFMEEVSRSGATLLPIDSEHNAIFQCLGNQLEVSDGVEKILLTGSGGPLLRRAMSTLAEVTPDEACAHPNWQMGRKISVDSATMMNKGLELIEACWLFDLNPDQIEIVIHPQSIVHSMVQYRDGSVLAQMGQPDMKIPIAHALAWPERMESEAQRLDFSTITDLQFESIELSRFPLLDLCRQVAGMDQCYAIALNSANEIAVAAFLEGQITFTQIQMIVEFAVNSTVAIELLCIADVLTVDQQTRALARQRISEGL
jgi:1-deoxy-D-xylulose-5-phosphate reductoisomerase